MTDRAGVFVLLALLLLAASPLPQDGPTIRAEVIRAYDGDTITVRLPFGPAFAPWVRELFEVQSVRLLGYDTPEIRGRCESERVLAKRARDFVRELLVGEVVTLRDVDADSDPYGRLLARVDTEDGPLADILVGRGLARYYDGEGARLPWCG